MSPNSPSKTRSASKSPLLAMSCGESYRSMKSATSWCPLLRATNDGVKLKLEGVEVEVELDGTAASTEEE